MEPSPQHLVLTFKFINCMDEIKVWNSQDSYDDGEPPCMVIECNHVYTFTALGMVRDTYGEDFVCLIKVK